jgi:hypothetical protein
MAKKDTWVQHVMENYASTDPPKRVFTADPTTIADAADVEGVAPKGLTSWQRMVLFHRNRGGKGLPVERRRALQDAVKLLSQRRLERQQQVNGFHEGTLLPHKLVPLDEFAKRLGEKAAQNAAQQPPFRDLVGGLTPPRPPAPAQPLPPAGAAKTEPPPPAFAPRVSSAPPDARQFGVDAPYEAQMEEPGHTGAYLDLGGMAARAHTSDLPDGPLGSLQSQSAPLPGPAQGNQAAAAGSSGVPAPTPAPQPAQQPRQFQPPQVPSFQPPRAAFRGGFGVIPSPSSRSSNMPGPPPGMGTAFGRRPTPRPAPRAAPRPPQPRGGARLPRR